MTRQNFSLADLKKSLVYEDPHLLVLNKSVGLLSQGGEADGSNLVDLLREYLGRPYVGLVHRLDRNTSGLMVVAKRSKAAERLSESLKRGELQREYVALLEGEIAAGEEREWTHWLRKDEVRNCSQVFRQSVSGAKESRLRIRAWKNLRFEGRPLTLATFRLETGRSHQIRAQSSFEGFPLLGDGKYGAPATKFPRPALHSYWIAFPHPKDGEGEKTFLAPWPEDFSRIVDVAEWEIVRSSKVL